MIDERATLLTRRDEGLGEGEFDSIAWAFSEHVKEPDDRRYQAAILYGAEDSPAMIEFYTAAAPQLGAKVDYIWRRDDSAE